MSCKGNFKNKVKSILCFYIYRGDSEKTRRRFVIVQKKNLLIYEKRAFKEKGVA